MKETEMVDEKTEPIVEEEAPKRAGRPSRKKAAAPKAVVETEPVEEVEAPVDEAKPADEPVVDSETEGAGSDDSDEKSEETTEDNEEKPKADKGTAPEGRIVPEGEDATVDTEEVNGIKVASETVYREKRLPNSQRYTYILVASKGTKVE